MKTLALLLLSLTTIAFAAEPWDTYSDTWVATDALGRKLPTSEEAGPPRKDRFVGVFYYIWHGSHGYGEHHDPSKEPSDGQGVIAPDPVKDAAAPFDITKILQAPESERKWGPKESFHHWSQPLFGYYVANDEWVIRKHAQMLADAGVDVIIFDVTNGYHYRDTYMNLLRIYADIRAHGGKTPQVAFMCAGNSETLTRDSITGVFRDLYQPGRYKDLWFIWKGKPLILAEPNGLTPEMTAFFTLRKSWAWSRVGKWFGDGKDAWSWVDSTPQNFGWHESPKVPEQTVVATAEHPHRDIGKSYHDGAPMHPPAAEEGLHFAEQWKRALQIDPEFLLITQWNEWVAMRFINEGQPHFKNFAGKPSKIGDSAFVDLFSQEYNRDIEPMAGGYGDNYYYQMIDGIRRFKGVRSGAIQVFRDTKGDVGHRAHFGWGGVGQYVNNTGRNDFETLEVRPDATNLTFTARTVDPITQPAGENWMELFIATDNAPNWEGYTFRVHLEPEQKQWYVVEKSKGGFHWSGVGTATFELKDNLLTVSVPRSLLPGTESGFRFKWSDNRQTQNAIDWLVDGDTAPDGRFQYEYRASKAAVSK